MSEVKWDVKVGDEVIVVGKDGREPQIKKVVKVTPKGNFRVEDNKEALFKQMYYDENAAYFSPRGYGAWKRGLQATPYSDEKWEKFVAEWVEKEKGRQVARKEKEERQKKREEERERCHLEELAECKNAVGHLALKRRLHLELDDGSTYEVFEIPSKREEIGFAVVTIQTQMVERMGGEKDGYKMVQKIEANASWVTGGGGSFTVSHGEIFNTTDEAIWEMIRSAYVGW